MTTRRLPGKSDKKRESPVPSPKALLPASPGHPVLRPGAKKIKMAAKNIQAAPKTQKPFQPSAPVYNSIQQALAKARNSRASLLSGKKDEIHDFRVGLRSLQTFCRLSRGILSPTQVEPIWGELKRIHQATSVFQDEIAQDRVVRTVLRYCQLTEEVRPWLGWRKDMLSRRREEAKAVIGAPWVADAINRAERLLSPFSGLEIPESLCEDIQRAYRKDRKKFTRFLTTYWTGKREDSALHKLRIAAKRMRYSLEGFDFLSPRRRKRLFPAAKLIQRTAGNLRDTLGAMRATGVEGQMPPKARAPFKKELARREQLHRQRVANAVVIAMRAIQ